MQEFVVEESDERIDTYLSKKLDISRSKVSKMLENNILVNDKKVKGSYIVKTNDVIKVDEYIE